MCRNFGVCWVDCKDPIDLMDRPLYNEIGLYWYQKATNTKWTYDLTNQLMVELGKKKNCTSFYDIDCRPRCYELHPWDGKVFDDFINEC